VSVTCKDGSVRNLEVLGALFGGRTLVIFSDVTERKRAGEELQKAKDALKRQPGQERVPGQHESRNQNADDGHPRLCGRAARAGGLPRGLSDRIEAARTIKTNGSISWRLSTNPRHLQGRSGQMTVERISCSPCRLIAEAAALGRAWAETKDWPSTSNTRRGPGDDPDRSTRFRQILVNLIGNAVKFTETGQVRLVTAFLQGDEGPRLQVDVADTGIGMTEEQAAGLFRPFAQADSSTTAIRGTGLGLMISRRLAKVLAETFVSWRPSRVSGAACGSGWPPGLSPASR